MINDRYVDLLPDEYKRSYTIFMQGGRLAPFSSHQPLLLHTLNTIKKGDVLEYGMGWNSTPIMHLICGMQGRKLLSVETELKWFNLFLDRRSEDHELLHLTEQELCKWDNPFLNKKYSVAFIDGAPPEARKVLIEKIKDNVDYFVVHDTEEYARSFSYPGFSYQWDFSMFKHVYHLQQGDPVTSLLSNLEEIDLDLLNIFQK